MNTTNKKVFNEMMLDYIKEEKKYLTKTSTNLNQFHTDLNSTTNYTNNTFESFLLYMYDKIIIELQKAKHIDNIESDYTLALCKQIIKSNLTIKLLMVNCNFFNAYVLLRKQLESATRVHELNHKNLTKLEKKSPNIDNTFKKLFKQIKSTLSEFVHVSDSQKVIGLNPLNTNLQLEFSISTVNDILQQLILINSTVAAGILNYSEKVDTQLHESFLKLFGFVFKVSNIEKLLEETQLIHLESTT